MSGIDKLHEAVEAMTPGILSVDPDIGDDGRREWDLVVRDGGAHVATLLESHADAHGIALLRNVAPELLAVVEAAREYYRLSDRNVDPIATGSAQVALGVALDALNRKLAEEDS